MVPAAEPQAGAKRSMEPSGEAPVNAKRARTETNAEGETFFDLGSLRRVCCTLRTVAVASCLAGERSRLV